MKRAVFPGSFDPITKGHLDIIERSTGLFDEIVIAVLDNPDKRPMFSSGERCEMISEVVEQMETGNCALKVDSFSGLLVDYVKSVNGQVIVRGLRAVSDYEYELRMALMNRHLEPGIETVFLMAAEEYSYVSSRLLKQVFQLGGSVDRLIPELVEKRMRDKQKREKE